MSPYGVREVARGSHPCSSSERWLAVFRAYFDESGNPPDKDVVTLAALVAPERKWTALEASWKKILRRSHVPFFHLTEYLARISPYDGWDEDDRISFAANLAGIAKNAIVFGSAHSVVVDDWQQVVVPCFPSRKLKRRSWYVFLEQGVLEDIVKYVKLPPGERIACRFDRNHDMDKSARKHYHELIKQRGWDEIFEGISFEDKTRFVPLQAADMLAGLVRFRVEEVAVHGSLDEGSTLLANLCADSQITAARYTQQRLIEHKERWIRSLGEVVDEENDE